MSLLSWLNLNLFFDISAFVFIGFLYYKSKKINHEFALAELKRQEGAELLREVIRNPAVAKRRLNKEK